ncbi:sulfite exporter TauE/SafE family protein [Candidatus Kaiserbacteria bacterium]|nr:sulfite exporter TauE/SafE family protein [Candidatus Kaiserbacteria bacterium]
MTFLAISFIAGVLTVLAPCILPLLPVVIGTSATGRSTWTPYLVVGSLSLSIILFTYLLKFSTALIMVPPEFWKYPSGGILVLFGLVFVFPVLWEKMPGVAALSRDSHKLVGAGYQRKSFWGDVLIGAALGPVFSSCSPTYFVILASVLPASFALGSLYLLTYTLGLSMILLLIGLLGQRFADRLTIAADSRGWFKRTVGVLFIAVGIFVATGYDKVVQVKILESGFVDSVKWEQNILQRIQL